MVGLFILTYQLSKSQCSPPLGLLHSLLQWLYNLHPQIYTQNWTDKSWKMEVLLRLYWYDNCLDTKHNKINIVFLHCHHQECTPPWNVSPPRSCISSRKSPGKHLSVNIVIFKIILIVDFIFPYFSLGIFLLLYMA